MDQQTSGNTAGYFQQALTLLGIESSSIQAGAIQTTAASSTITDDSSNKSLIKPLPVSFSSAAARDAFLSFAQINAANSGDFPMQVNTYNANDVTVTAGNPLVINSSSSSPVIVNIRRLTLQPGGQIQCKCGVILSVDNFNKQ